MKCSHDRDALIAVEGTTKYVCPVCRKTFDESSFAEPVAANERALPAAGEVFVARERELKALWKAWAETNDHQRPHVVLLEGTPGIGKTAVVERFYRQLASTTIWDPEDYWPDAPPGRLDQISDRRFAKEWAKRKGRRPLFLWFGARCNQTDLSDEPGDAEVAADLDPWKFMLEGTQLHLKLGKAAWRGWIPVLGDVLKAGALEAAGSLVPGLGFVKDVTQSVGRKLRGRDKVLEDALERLDELVVHTFARLCDAQSGGLPLVLYFEDLQWADGRSLDKLLELLDRTAGQPLMVIGTVRTVEALAEQRPVTALMSKLERRSGSDLGYAAIEVGTLARSDIEHQLTALFGAGADHSVVSWLADKADGVPLFAGELARLAVDLSLVDTSGRYVGERSVADLDAAWQSNRLPHDVKGVIDERIGRLKAQDWRQYQLLAFGAVQGRTFEDRLLAAASKSESELSELNRDGIRRLMTRVEEVHAVVHGNDPIPYGNDFLCSYVFTHGLLHEAFARSLRLDERIKCLNLLLELYDDGDECESSLGALRRLEALDLVWRRIAGLKALDAEEWSKYVLTVVAVASHKLSFGSVESVRPLSSRAIRLAEEFGEQHPGAESSSRVLAAALRLGAEVAKHAGDHEQVERHLRRALELVRPPKHHGTDVDELRSSVFLEVLEALGDHLAVIGDAESLDCYATRVDLARAWVARSDEPDAYEALCRALRDLAIALVDEPHRHGEALRFAEERLTLAEKLSERDNESFHLGEAMSGLADICHALGQHDRATALRKQRLTRARELRRERQGPETPDMLIDALCELGENYTDQDQLSEAEPLLEEALTLAREAATGSREAIVLGRLDRAYRLMGDLLRARGEQERLRELLQSRIDLNRDRVDEFDDVGTRMALLESLEALGEFLVDHNRDGARIVFEDRLELARQLHEQCSDPRSEECLLEALNDLARLHVDSEDPHSARTLTNEALARARRRAKHSGRRIVRIDLADSLEAAAGLEQLEEHGEQAVELWREALAIRRKLFDEAPQLTVPRNALAGTIEQTARAMVNFELPGDAETHAREAIALRRRAREADDSQDARRLLASSLGLLAKILADKGKTKEMRALEKETRELDA